MKREQLKEIMPIYEAWISGIKIGVLDHQNNVQNDDINPTSFHLNINRMYINDAYADIRIHIIKGGKVIVKANNGEFEFKNAKPDIKFIFTVSSYKCIPLTDWVDELEVGDDIVRVDSRKIITISQISKNVGSQELNYYAKHQITFKTPSELRAQFQPWKPKAGEWCWFWEENCPPVVQQFGRMNKSLFLDEYTNSYENCKPFTEELFWVKEKDEK